MQLLLSFCSMRTAPKAFNATALNNSGMSNPHSEGEDLFLT